MAAHGTHASDDVTEGRVKFGSAAGDVDRRNRARFEKSQARVDDIRAVLDAAGSDRIVAIGLAHGGALCSYFAASYPERTAGLILYGPVPYMFGVDAPGVINSNRDEFLRTWGTTEGARDVVDFAAPSRAGAR